MKLTFHQLSALDELWTGVDPAEADDPALEIEDDFAGNVVVCLRRRDGKRNLTLGTIAPNGTVTPPKPEPEPKEVKAKNLRVGYGVWAEGAPAASRIHTVRRDHPDHPGKIVAGVDWGHIVYDPNELVKVDSPVLHPQLLDSTGTEFGLCSMLREGEDHGEVVEIVEPDESHWRIRVGWGVAAQEPETYDVVPAVGTEDPLFVADLVVVS
jgi:hypothetical protein